ncbi:TolC family protein [Vibrio metschnikovii]
MQALIERAQQQNLALLSSRIAQDVAKDNIALASSGHLPSLKLNGGYNYARESNSNNSANNTDFNDFTIGLNLNVPLYTGGNVTSLTKQAEHAFVAASQDLEATFRSVVKDVRAYNNNINASIGALRAYEQSVISARSA